MLNTYASVSMPPTTNDGEPSIEFKMQIFLIRSVKAVGT